VQWIIFGGESGSSPRTSEAQWAADTRDQCHAYRRKFFFKQAGVVLAREWGCQNKEGKSPEEWPDEFRVQEFPKAA
jgi:protein gp37